jgi:HKD family nuclease
MQILTQPFDGQLGDILIDKLKQPFTQFAFFTAFAKNSGVLRVKDDFLRFRAQGRDIHAYVGIDLDGTSYEALVNLFGLCSSLTVIHSENPITTFHSKIYALNNGDAGWVTIGSNNLTGGGLWTNIESFAIHDYDLNNGAEASHFNSIQELITKFNDPAFACSMKINSQADIEALAKNGYVKTEAQIRISSNHSHAGNPNFTARKAMFGPLQGTRIPTILPKPTPIATAVGAVRAANIIQREDFSADAFWFETRQMTSASGNSLDLASEGTLLKGSVAGTKYATNKPNKMLGGVAFFDIDPSDHKEQKIITIHYDGHDYCHSMIKFPSGGNRPNGTWRLYLTGDQMPPSKPKIALGSVDGHDKFRFKILLFEKINTDYYSLSVLDDSELPRIYSKSKVVASKTKNSRQFGIL